jgi:acyl dehydratase
MVRRDKSGTKFGEFEFPVERGKIKEFAGAILDPNPVYRDVQYAQSRGFDSVIIPVTFPATFAFHLPSENLIVEMMQELEMNLATSVHGEVEFTMERPIIAGETLKGEITIGDIYEKEGKRGGKMTFVEMAISFTDENDKQVATMKNVFIERN